jgi:hypothetical protein
MYEINISPSNTASCRDCGEKIIKGDVRLTFYYSYRGYEKVKHYCRKCAVKLLQEVIKKYTQFIGGLLSNKLEDEDDDLV